ncbi:MAG: P27 family phage terminase small subunit [Pseudomonadota bacterium]
MRGRKKTPTLLKIISGRPASELPQHEPKVEGDIGAAPEWFSPSQREAWDYAVQHAPAGLLKSLDESILTAWTLAFDAMRQASEKIKTAVDNDEFRALSRVLAQQSGILVRTSSELGFSPASRARVAVAPVEREKNPFERFQR